MSQSNDLGQGQSGYATGRTVGDHAQDAVTATHAESYLRARIAEALVRVGITRVEIAVVDGGAVTLSGGVPDQDTAHAAVALARSIPGIATVQSSISIDPPKKPQ